MSITQSNTGSLRRKRPHVGRLLRLLAFKLTQKLRPSWRTGGVPDHRIRHDIALDREHQEYATGPLHDHASRRALHARAERIAAGLPE